MLSPTWTCSSSSYGCFIGFWGASAFVKYLRPSWAVLVVWWSEVCYPTCECRYHQGTLLWRGVLGLKKCLGCRVSGHCIVTLCGFNVVADLCVYKAVERTTVPSCLYALHLLFLFKEHNKFFRFFWMSPSAVQKVIDFHLCCMKQKSTWIPSKLT